MSIYEIAKQAGVSVSTVSRVLNGKGSMREETRKKVQQVLDQSQYVPSVFARGLANSTMHQIGILSVDIRNHHHADIAYIIEQTFTQFGYSCILCNTGLENKSQDNYISLMANRRVDGLVLIGSVFESSSVGKSLQKHCPNTPVVIANGYLAMENVRGVICDEYSAAVDCVAHLAQKGHTQIALIMDKITPSNQQKLVGYEEGLKRNRLNLDKRNMICGIPSAFENGYDATKKLMAQNPLITAIVFTEDPIAVGGTKYLIESGRRVPGDIEVIGFNNSDAAKMCTPELTSVDNQMEATGTAAARILHDMIEGVKTPARLILDAEIIFRKSSPA